MPYMLLIVEPQGQRRLRSPQEGHAVYEQMLEYTAGLKGGVCCWKATRCVPSRCDSTCAPAGAA